jgi:hypothetical protein
MKVSFFSSFYTDLFDRAGIIDSRLQVFVRFVIAALTANNPGGVFTTIIASLTTAYTAYFGDYNTKNVSLATKKGSTSSLDTVSRLFADTVRSKYNTIASVYPIGTAIYIEFFPNGLTEFSRLTRANILSISHRMTIKSAEYKATLGGQPFADLFSGLETSIGTAIGTQNTNKSGVQAITSAVINNRQPVEDQLMKVMYAVGSQFWPVASTCNSYFNFPLLFSVNTHPSVVVHGTVNFLSTALCIGSGIDTGSVFTLKNQSDMPLTFFGAHIVGGPMVGVAITVDPHSQNVAGFADFGAADMNFLYVKNTSDFDGSWEVRVD